jgi:hypothetical protein
MHPANSLPQLSDDVIHFKDFIDKTWKVIQIIRYDFKRLPKPYDTQCYEYPANETQFHCLNECYRKAYEKRFHCIPKYNSLLTIQLFDDYIEPNVTFCSEYYINENNEFNNIISKLCYYNCPIACMETVFEAKLSDFIFDDNLYTVFFNKLKFQLNNNFNSNINYLPKMTFIELLICISNVLSLWHGMTFIGIIVDLFHYIGLYSQNVQIYIKLKLYINQIYKNLIIFIRKNISIKSNIKPKVSVYL